MIKFKLSCDIVILLRIALLLPPAIAATSPPIPPTDGCNKISPPFDPSPYSEDDWYAQKYFHEPPPTSFDDATFQESTTLGKSVEFRPLLDPILIPRVSGFEDILTVKDFIVSHLTSLNWGVEVNEFNDTTPLGELSFYNIIATLNPNAKRVLMLACHYDTKYFPEDKKKDTKRSAEADDEVSSTSAFVGATDSAVPCAMLLHLASSLKDKLESHRTDESANVTLQLVFFDGEEAYGEWSDTDSLYGSRHLSEKWRVTSYPEVDEPSEEIGTNMIHRIDIMVLLDLLGGKDVHIRNFFEATAPWFKTLNEAEDGLKRLNLWEQGEDEKPRVNVFNSSIPGWFIEDDHVPFMNKCVRVLHLISTPFPKPWHTTGDNLEYLDFEMINNLNNVWRLFVVNYLGIDITESGKEEHEQDVSD